MPSLHLRLLPSLLALPVLILLLGLGQWQWQRAAEKQHMLDASALRRSDVPVRLDGHQTVLADVLYRQVEVTGEYLPQQYLLDNQVLHHQAGYHVLTPLRLASGVVALVNRGWLPVGESRNRLIALSVPEGQVEVRGELRGPPGLGLYLGEPDSHGVLWPKLIQYIDFSRIETQLQAKVLPYIILLDPAQPNGFSREWPVLVSAGPERHIGYAVQWFALALSWVVLVITAQLRWSNHADRDQS